VVNVPPERNCGTQESWRKGPKFSYWTRPVVRRVMRVCVVQLTTHVDRESAVTSVCRSRDIQASRVPVQIQTISCSTLWIAEDYSALSVILLHQVSINASQPMNLKCKQN